MYRRLQCTENACLLVAGSCEQSRFPGTVVHSIDFGQHLDEILAAVPSGGSGDSSPTIVVVGGGKSVQDVSSYLSYRRL